MTSNRFEDAKHQHVVLYEEDMGRISPILDGLLTHSGATSVMLVDKDGFMIARSGSSPGYDPETVSALVASSFAVTREVARVLGSGEFSATFDYGSRGSIQMLIAGDRAVLAVVFNEETTMDKVREYADRAAKGLAGILENARQRQGQDEVVMHEDFHRDAEQKIDDLFKEKPE